MPTVKINAVQLLNHGVSSPAVVSASAGVSKPAPAVVAAADLESQVMTAASRVAVTKASANLAKIVIAAKNPAQLAASMIQARYAALGGAQGFLGAATTPVNPCPDKLGYYRHFKGGSIYWHPRCGAHETHGLIRGLWASLGWERSWLGYPCTDELTGSEEGRRGRYNHFENGSIYWHPDTGAHEVHGAIRAKYFELGAEAGFLGYPTTDETKTPDGVGRFNHFQGGSIYWTPRTWAHEVHGLIRGCWAAHGWERNAALGYPISDERIPDRGIGHRPGAIASLPHLVLPPEQLSPLLTNLDLQPAIAVAPKTKVAAPPKANPAAPVKKPAVGNVARAKNVSVAASISKSVQAVHTASPVTAARPVLVAGRPVLLNPALLPRDHTGASRDRYSDFENGVVFWRHGASAAEIINPRAKAPNGAKMAWTAAEIAALAGARIRAALGTIPGGAIKGITFAGTTDYSWDGAGVHNRNHRCNVVIQGRRKIALATVTVTAVVEVRVEISFDPVDREIGGYITGWTLKSSQGNFVGGGDLARLLHGRLDPQIWRQFPVTTVPATSKDPIAVLAVKTHADGRVAVYFEP